LSKLFGLVDDLRAGKSVEYPHTGGYLAPKVRNGETVKVFPATLSDLNPEDIVLCRIDGKIILGMVKDFRSDRAMISDVAGKKMGWATNAHIYGKAKVLL